MSEQPFTAKLKRTAKVSITVQELINATSDYVESKFQIKINHISLHIPDDLADVSVRTIIVLGNIVAPNDSWKSHELNFSINGLRTQSARTRLGGETQLVTVWKMPKGDYDGFWRPSNKWEKVADVAAEPNRDRSITFYPIDHWEGATAFFKRTPSTQDADFFYRRGFTYMNQGQDDLATKDFDEAVRLNPNHGEIFHNRGCLYLQKGQNDLAIQDFNKVLRLNPNTAMTFGVRGLAFAKKGEFDLAIQDFDEAIRLNPKAADAFCNRAAAYCGKRQNERAVQDLDHAIRLEPNNALYFYSRGCVLRDLGQQERASADFSKARQLGFEEPDATVA